MDPNPAALEVALKGYLDGQLTRRQFAIRALALGVGATSIAAILAACGTGNSSSSTGSTTPVKGGMFIEGYDRSFVALQTLTLAWVDPPNEALLEPLVSLDPDGKLVPNLAASWTTNPDSSVWTFTLRPGLKYQTGKAITADDVAALFNLMRTKGAVAPFWSAVTDVSAGPNNTVVVTAKHPFAILQDTLRNEFSNLYDLQAANAAGSSYGSTVVAGTGPYKLREFAADHVTVDRWADYPGSIVPWFSNKGTAYLDSIKWVAITEPANRANEIQSGSVHALKNPLPQDLDSLKGNSNLIVTELQDNGGLTFGLNLTKTNLGFDDVRVRQAISHAIDRKSIVQTILFGHGVPTYGPFPTAYKWYEPGVEKFNQFDVNMANSLLDAAGWTKGSDGVRAKNGNKLSFTVYNQTDTTRNLVGQAIASMLANVGVTANFQNLETGAFFNSLGANPEAFFFQWLWTSPPNLLDDLVHPDWIPGPNWQRANIQVVTDTVNQWRNGANDTQLEAAARAMQLSIAEQLPTLTIYTPNVVWVQSKKVHGWRPTKTNLYSFYNDVWLEK